MAGKILNSNVEKYLESLLPKRDAILTEMERYARKHDVPIIGPACGRLLYLLAQTAGAKRIFEMGSAIGYSTIWLARAAGPGVGDLLHGWQRGECEARGTESKSRRCERPRSNTCGRCAHASR